MFIFTIQIYSRLKLFRRYNDDFLCLFSTKITRIWSPRSEIYSIETTLKINKSKPIKPIRSNIDNHSPKKKFNEKQLDEYKPHQIEMLITNFSQYERKSYIFHIEVSKYSRNCSLVSRLKRIVKAAFKAIQIQENPSSGKHIALCRILSRSTSGYKTIYLLYDSAKK